MYKETTTLNSDGEIIKDTSGIVRISDDAYIPKDIANTDYQDYLEWAKSNTITAATLPSDWDLVRDKRDRLLRNSDWTMTTGATVDQAQWSAYREKLSDIPQTYKGKATSEIVWPTAPSTKGPNSQKTQGY